VSSQPDVAGGGGHVVDEIGDFVTGRLSADRVAQVERHLESCPACAADFAWAVAFHARGRLDASDVDTEASSHVGPDRIALLSEGAPVERGEREHLAKCDACRHEIDLLRSLAEPDAMKPSVRQATPARATVPRPRRGRWREWSVGLVAVAAALVLLLHPWRDDLDAVRALSRVEALPVRVPRSVPEAGAFDTLRQRGLEAYARGDYASARHPLVEAAKLRPEDAEVQLYLGSCLLLEKNPDAAREALARALATAPPGELVSETSRWLLANALLALGRPAEAVPELRTLTDAGGPHAGAAADLLEELDRLGVLPVEDRP
jgi:hypothetical protein